MLKSEDPRIIGGGENYRNVKMLCGRFPDEVSAVRLHVLSARRPSRPSAKQRVQVEIGGVL